MRRNELIQRGDSVFRVLETRKGEALVINCVQKSMPKWADQADFTDYAHMFPTTQNDIAAKLNMQRLEKGC